ncbi:MAG: primosomal protein [Candidatus Nomurabacteria bacterium]|nr:primosomal protein [Candidatus Nomurabacteria bacterium]
MYIATVIPISKGIPFDTLSYYSAELLDRGTIVSVPLGKQKINAIIAECQNLSEAKTAIKQASFALKKIHTVVGHVPLLGAVIEGLVETSARTLTPLGAIAGAVMPSTLFDYVSPEKIIIQAEETEMKKQFKEESVVGTTLDRTDFYKRLIRTSFAAKKSILFIAPTIKNLEQWKTILQKGIPKHVVTVHSKTTKKNLRGAFALIKQSDRPLIIFATPGYAVLPRHDIGTVIVEDESNSLYKTSDRFKTDLRIFLGAFAKAAEVQLCWGDTIPRLETLERTEKTMLPRTFIPDKLHVVPVEPYRTILPTEVIEIIRHAEAKKKRLYIYASRKGVAPLSRCADCGTIVICEVCGLPMVLKNRRNAEGLDERYFVCTHCVATLPATHTCAYCGSWNITPVSIGTESIRDAVAALVGSEAVTTIDDDLTPDSNTIETLLSQSEKQKFSIVIGTIKVLPFLKNINYTLFPFFDRLLSTPSLYTTENTLRLVMECNERAVDGVLLFTRQPDFPLIKQLETHKINALIHDELTLRKEIGYPPYGSIIKISLTVPEGYRLAVVEKMQSFLEDMEATMMPARRISVGSMKVLVSWIVKTGTNYIEEEGPTLASFLTSLHFPYMIEENPERL